MQKDVCKKIYMYLETAFIDQLTASFMYKQISVDYHIGDLSPSFKDRLQ